MTATSSAGAFRIERTESDGYGKTWLIYRPDGSIDETDSYNTRQEAREALPFVKAQYEAQAARKAAQQAEFATREQK
jgi:hypothetical protein